MKRTTFKRKKTKPMKRAKLRLIGKSPTSLVKKEIQDALRELVIKRDGGCVLRGKFGHVCSGTDKNGNIVLQADHLIERSNSATYADSRLVVCVCKGLHGWKHFKKSNHDKYNDLIKHIISPERVELWKKCEQETYVPKRTGVYDWKLHLVVLLREINNYG